MSGISNDFKLLGTVNLNTGYAYLPNIWNLSFLYQSNRNMKVCFQSKL